MLEIKLTADARQKHQIGIPTLGSTFDLSLYFISQQNGWFITELKFEEIKIKNLRICNNLQILYQYRFILPFGLACISVDDREPMFIQDFFQKKSKLMLLDSTEVEEYTDSIYGT